jgi:hypothetical protein
LALWLSSNSCATPHIEGRRPEFNDYVEDFVKLLPEHAREARELKVGFENFKMYPSKKDRDIIGRCYYDLIVPNTVTFDYEYWQTASPTSKYFTFLHEFGHCVCYSHHTEITQGWTAKLEEFLFKLKIWKRKGYMDDGCPASLMHPSSFDDSCALRHWNYYINEFKETCRSRSRRVK